MLPFNVVKPTLADGILSLIDLTNDEFNTEKFQETIRRKFQAVGMCPNDDEQFVEIEETVHKEISKGSLQTSTENCNNKFYYEEGDQWDFDSDDEEESDSEE